MKNPNARVLTLLLISITLLSSGCLTGEKLARRVDNYYGGQVPRERKTKHEEIEVIHPAVKDSFPVAMGLLKKNKSLPLLFYWHYDWEVVSILNRDIPARYITNTVHQHAPKELLSKLKGRKLEIYVDDVSKEFSVHQISKAYVILIYPIHDDRIFLDPDDVDLKLRYRLLEGSTAIREGQLTIKNPMGNKRIQLFQSLKSALSDYLDAYQTNVANMTKEALKQINTELGELTALDKPDTVPATESR